MEKHKVCEGDSEMHDCLSTESPNAGVFKTKTQGVQSIDEDVKLAKATLKNGHAFQKNVEALSQLITAYHLAVNEQKLEVAEMLYTKVKNMQHSLDLDKTYGNHAVELNKEICVIFLGVDCHIAELRYKMAIENATNSVAQ